MVIPIRGADGIDRQFLTRISPTFDQHGAVDNWFGVNTDISLQVQAEDAAAKSEARFRVIADSMPQMVWSAQPDGNTDYYNARWYEFTGMPIGSTDGWSELLHPEDRDRAVRNWRECVANGSSLYQEYRLRHRSGSYRWVLGRADAERDTQGALTRWYGTCTDIEEIVQARGVLQRARDELEQQVIASTGERNLLATLVETTDVLIMAVDLNYRILAINKANADVMDRIYGVRGRVGANLLELLAHQPEQQAAVKEAWARGLAGEEITLIEAHGDPSRQRNTYEIKFRPLFNDAGDRIGAFQFVQDVSERLRDQAKLAQAQEALLQSQKLDAMGRLTGGVAHDFNNLLSPIMGSLDILQRRGVGGAREQRLIKAAYQSADRAKILVQRLLAFARRQPLQSTVVDLGALVRGFTDLLISTLGPQIVLSMEVPEGVFAARVDPNQLELALLNLAVNSRDAISGAGAIRIALIREMIEPNQVNDLQSGSYIRLSVEDTGQGMDEATRLRAVEPFFSTKGIGKGTGLGLSMAHGLASQLGGTLTLESQLGHGTTVSIWLPESPEQAQSLSQSGRSVTRAVGAGTALLVDDEESIRLTTGDMLTELGFSLRR